MKPFNRNASSMPESGIRLIFEKSITMDDVIHLEVGQPDFRTPEHMLDAICDAAHEGFTKYTSAGGTAELVELIAEKVRTKNGFAAGPENIVVSPGAVCSLYSVLLALVEPGEEILMSDPTWPNYVMQASCLGAKVVHYPLDPKRGFQIDFDTLEQLAGPKTKVLLVNSPSNPTGAMQSRESVERLVDFARRKNLWLISDEVYEDIVFEGEHISIGQYNTDGRIVSIYGFSKSYAATGLRIGYMVAEPKLASLVFKLQEPMVTSASSISQKACAAALSGPQEPVAAMTAAYRERRDTVIDILKRHDLYTYTPSGAFYILIDISRSGKTATDFALELLERDRVGVAPGESFGSRAASFVRVSFCVDTDKLATGMETLCRRINGS